MRDARLRDQAGSVLLLPALNQRLMIADRGDADQNLPPTNKVDIIGLTTSAATYRSGVDDGVTQQVSGNATPARGCRHRG